MNQIGKKAKLYVDPIEQEYVEIYGRLPDYDYTDFYNQHGSIIAGKIIQGRIDGIWQDMKDRQNPTFKTIDNNPFNESDYQTIGRR